MRHEYLSFGAEGENRTPGAFLGVTLYRRTPPSNSDHFGLVLRVGVEPTTTNVSDLCAAVTLPEGTANRFRSDCLYYVEVVLSRLSYGSGAP